MLDVLTRDLTFTFKISDPKDAVRSLCIDRPLIIIDDLKTLKKFADWTSSFTIDVGSIQLKFRLRCICGIKGGHWETMVVPNSSGKCKCLKVDVNKKGADIDACKGQDFTQSRDQMLYVYELTQSLLQHPNYSFLHSKVDEYHREHIMKFVRQTQEHPDTSAALRTLLEKCTSNAPKPLDQMSLRELIPVLAPVLKTNPSLWKHLKTYCTHGCLHDYSHIFNA
jgi:hypothetical protein